MAKYNVKGFAFIGRTFDEYIKMFGLGEDDLSAQTILDCPGGACSFTAEANAKGFSVTAIDCEYGKNSAEFDDICQKELDKISVGFSGAEELFDWSLYGDLAGLLEYRKSAVKAFLLDYKRHPHHYRHGVLPKLNVEDNQFDIVLSGHFLFLYADRLDLDFHVNAILELVRMARKEVRIYPLIGLDGSPYSQMHALIKKIAEAGYFPEKVDTTYQFLKGSHQFLKVRKKSK